MGVVSPFLRKVKTASGAMAVQIAVKEGRRDKVIEHLGSAHTEAELAALMEIGRHRIAPDQLTLELTLCRSEERRVGKECRSRWSPYH